MSPTGLAMDPMPSVCRAEPALWTEEPGLLNTLSQLRNLPGSSAQGLWQR